MIPLQWSTEKTQPHTLVCILLHQAQLVETPTLVYHAMRASWAFFSYTWLLLRMSLLQETTENGRRLVQTGYNPRVGRRPPPKAHTCSRAVGTRSSLPPWRGGGAAGVLLGSARLCPSTTPPHRATPHASPPRPHRPPPARVLSPRRRRGARPPPVAAARPRVALPSAGALQRRRCRRRRRQ